MNNRFALATLTYIWNHPNSRDRRWRALAQFFRWQFQKRLSNTPWDLPLVPGLSLRCYANSHCAAAAIYCGLYDYDEMTFLLRYLRPGDSVLDVGANIGIYSLLAASRIESGTIYSFEALPQNHDRLQENLALNSLTQVKTYPIAVSDRSGTVSLNLAEGDSMPFISSDRHPAGSNPDRCLTVPTDTLDHCLAGEPIEQLSLGKMDIEGAELLALQGATQLLERQRPNVWILELIDTVVQFGYCKQDLIDFLGNYGYGFYRYSADSNCLMPYNAAEQSGNNVLAIVQSELPLVYERLGLTDVPLFEPAEIQPIPQSSLR